MTAFSQSSLSALESRSHWGIKKGLSNIRALLAALGSPEKTYPAALIAGTNGKGSTGCFLAHALKSAGLKIGWTTSPHLASPAERIWIDGKPISESGLDSLLKEVLEAEAGLGLKATYFELMVAAAILGFKNASVDLALVEVGMGGRWDSTNVLDPILTVMTNVALDHTSHLGDTLEAIAAEKLCTARDGRPLVLGPGLDPAWLAPLCECKPKMVLSVLPEAEIFWDHSLVNGHRINLAGMHQMCNLATALAALGQLRIMGWALDSARLYKGLSQAEWPSRFWKPPGLSNVFFDGAHNASGAGALADHLNRFGMRPHIFFSAMGDKDISGIACALASANPLSVTLIEGWEARCAPPDAMRIAWMNAGYADLPLLKSADLIPKLQKNETDVLIVTGSLYFVGHLLKDMYPSGYLGNCP